jgi:acetyl esterase/lipase
MHIVRCGLVVVLGLIAWMDCAPPSLAAEPSIRIVRDKTYVERPSGPLAADVYLPRGDGPFPAMLVVHGGAWRFGSRSQLAAAALALADNGYVAVAINYRLAPQHTFPAQLHDCQAAVRWVRTNAKEYKIDPNRVGGFGYSAGGHLVALMGVLSENELREPGLPADLPSARLQLVVAGGAPCDFRTLPANDSGLAYWLGGTRGRLPNAYRDASPAEFVSKDDPPMFFFHGEKDELVPLTGPKAMVARLDAVGVRAEMHEVPSAGHLEAIVHREVLGKVLTFTKAHLQASNHGK